MIVMLYCARNTFINMKPKLRKEVMRKIASYGFLAGLDSAAGEAFLTHSE